MTQYMKCAGLGGDREGGWQWGQSGDSCHFYQEPVICNDKNLFGPYLFVRRKWGQRLLLTQNWVTLRCGQSFEQGHKSGTHFFFDKKLQRLIWSWVYFKNIHMCWLLLLDDCVMHVWIFLPFLIGRPVQEQVWWRKSSIINTGSCYSPFRIRGQYSSHPTLLSGPLPAKRWISRATSVNLSRTCLTT